MWASLYFGAARIVHQQRGCCIPPENRPVLPRGAVRAATGCRLGAMLLYERQVVISHTPYGSLTHETLGYSNLNRLDLNERP